MKVLFLDCDGVLNNTHAWEQMHRDANAKEAAAKAAGVEPVFGIEVVYVTDFVCVMLLHEIIARTGARIVLSSTWRRDPDAVQLLRDRKVLTPENSHPALCTPILDGLRGHDIERWMQVNGEPERYAIVDDDSDFIEHQQPYHVKTNCYIGLQREHAERLVAILNR